MQQRLVRDPFCWGIMFSSTSLIVLSAPYQCNIIAGEASTRNFQLILVEYGQLKKSLWNEWRKRPFMDLNSMLHCTNLQTSVMFMFTSSCLWLVAARLGWTFEEKCFKENAWHPSKLSATCLSFFDKTLWEPNSRHMCGDQQKHWCKNKGKKILPRIETENVRAKNWDWRYCAGISQRRSKNDKNWGVVCTIRVAKRNVNS